MPQAVDITAIETIVVGDRVVACDGGTAGLGHPRVWLRIVEHDIVCPYCSRHYVLSEGVESSGHH